jgi:phage terminase large subunit-like protein
MACVDDGTIAEGADVYLGLDLSSVIDLTALVMVAADDPAHVVPFFWKPQEQLVEHSNRDFGSGDHRYVSWAANGHLLICPGRSIDPTVVATKIAELTSRYRIRGLAYDRWRMKDLQREFDRIGLNAYEDNEKGIGDGLRLVPWGQGFKEMAPAIDALERAVLERTLKHNSSPPLNFCMANAVVTMDPAANRKLDKDKSRMRIDGAVALAMAMGLRSRDRTAKPIDIEALIG